jgi:hypothetical protein
MDAWVMFDNSGAHPKMIAREESGAINILDRNLFATITNSID